MVVDWSDQYGPFWRFTAERHQVFRNRVLLKRPPPWTNDPILRRVSFCNIYRELDRVTRVLTRSFPKSPRLDDLLFNVIKFRYFTWPPTYEALGGYQPAARWDEPAARKQLAAMQDRGERLFTGAFMMTGMGSGPGGKGKSRLGCLTWVQSQLPRLTDAVFSTDSMQQAHAVLEELPYFGGFMAYEVLIDLTYTGRVLFTRDQWVYVGPGALKGLQLLHKGPLPEDPALLIAALRDWQVDGFRLAGVKMNGPRLTLENVEQALCEFQKWYRASQFGVAKRRFAAEKCNTDYALWSDLPEEFLDEQYWVP